MSDVSWVSDCPLTLPPGQLQSLVQGGIAAHRRRHEKAIALAQDALDIVGIHMRVADDNIMLLAGAYDPRHPFQHFGVLVLARIPGTFRRMSGSASIPRMSSIIRMTKISPLGLSGQTSARS